MFYLSIGAVILLSVMFWRPLFTAIGKQLVQRSLDRVVSGVRFVSHQAQLNNEQLYWYLERQSDGPADGPPLVVLPGATVSMVVMGAQLRKLCTALPRRRIIIIELPYHGQNVATNMDFTGQASSLASMADFFEALTEAAGLSEPFDLLGYSLGGGIAAHFAAASPKRLRRLLLLAPYFHETLTNDFSAKLSASDWRNIHGWESYSEMKYFFHRWLGLSHKDFPPQIVLRGIYALRKALYPEGYWTAFFNKVNERSSEHKTFLTKHSAALAQMELPTLLITATEDAVCDAQKLRSLESILGAEHCRVHEESCGHFFGPKGKTLLNVSVPEMLSFLIEKK